MYNNIKGGLTVDGPTDLNNGLSVNSNVTISNTLKVEQITDAFKLQLTEQGNANNYITMRYDYMIHGSGQYLCYSFLTYYGMSRSGQHFICAHNSDDVCEQAFLGSGRQRILLVTEILLVGGRALQ